MCTLIEFCQIAFQPPFPPPQTNENIVAAIFAENEIILDGFEFGPKFGYGYFDNDYGQILFLGKGALW